MKAAALNPDVVLQPHQQRIADEAAAGAVRKLLVHGLGSGKCVRGDTLVLVNGEFREIQSLFSTELATPEQWLDVSGLVTVNWDSQSRLTVTPIRRLYRQRLPAKESTFCVETLRGNRIECTGRHRLLVARDCTVQWVPTAELRVGDWVALAGQLPAMPAELAFSDEEVELLTWQVMEGHEVPATAALSIFQKNTDVLRRLRATFRAVAASHNWPTGSGHVRTRTGGVGYIAISCARYKNWLNRVGYSWGKLSADKQLPASFYGLPQPQIVACLRAWLQAEGHVGSQNIEISSASRRLCQQLQYLLLRVGVRSSIHSKRGRATNGSRLWRTYWRVSISGEDVVKFRDRVGVGCDNKYAALERICAGKRNPNYGVPFFDFQSKLFELGFDSVLDRHGFNSRVPKQSVARSTAEKIHAVLERFLVEGLPPSRHNSSVSRQLRAQLQRRLAAGHADTAKLVCALRTRLSLPFVFEPIRRVDLGQSGGIVYDMEVEAANDDSHSYVAGTGGFICHNSLSSIAAMEQDDDPYVAVVPAALRPNYRKELAKFTDRDMLPTVLSYNALAAGQAPNTSKLVLDEVQRLRNPDSAQTKAVLDAAGKAKSLIMLSGTPVVNRPGDLAVPLQLLTGKKMTPDEFEARYVEHKPVYSSFLHRLLGTSSGTEPVIRRRKELEALLRGHVDYYMPEKPVVPVDYEDHEIEMSVPQVQLYRAMLDKLPWHIRRQLNQSVDPAPEDMTRLMAFMTGPRQVGLSTLPFRRDKDPLKAFEQSPKLQTALAKLKEHLTDDRKKALVFANFIDAGLTPYSAALTREGIPHGVFHGGLSDADRQRLVDDYNEGRIRAALIGPSGTEGLSFKGTQLVQLLDPHWQQTRPRQAVGRGLRFDSHEGLPDELKRVRVQRFISKLPGGLARRLARLTGGQDPEIDRYLQATAERKDKENALMLGLLKDVGTPKAAADALPALLAAKRESDRRNYPAKHEALVRLLRSSPQDFEIDSAVDGTVGLTHSPTGFRIHMPAVKLPTAFLTRGRHEDDRTA